MQLNQNFISPNFANRTEKIEYIILHYTEMTFDDALVRLCDNASQVSAHYLIKDDGQIFQLVSPEKIAWHAGKSYWRGKDQLNQCSIGIELDNLGNAPFKKQQMEACAELCRHLMNKYAIPRQNVIGHSDIAPERKIDPGIFFNWHFMAERGIGLVYGPPANATNSILFSFGDTGNQVAHTQQQLKDLGYKIDVTGVCDAQTNNVIRAFTAHFLPKIICSNGLDYYRNQASLYPWTNCCKETLDSAILKKANN